MTAEIRQYDIAPDRDVRVAGYALSVLEEIAAGVPTPDETPAEFVQRHLDYLVERGYITPQVQS